MITEDSLAPDFTLMDADGKPVTLSSFRGRWVILYFYPQDDTPGCTKEACSFRDGMAELTQKNAVVLGVSPDTVESHAAFRAKFGLPFALLADPEKKVLTEWGAWGEKNLYGKIVVGVLRRTFVIGPDGRVKKVIKRVTTDAATHQVLPHLVSS